MPKKIYDIIIGDPRIERHPAIHLNPDSPWPSDVKRLMKKAKKKWNATGKNIKRVPVDSFFVVHIPFAVQYKISRLLGNARGDSTKRNIAIKRAREATIKALRKAGATPKDIKMAKLAYWS